MFYIVTLPYHLSPFTLMFVYTCRAAVFTLLLFVVFPVTLWAQHHGGHSDAPGIKETFVVDGFRVGDTPPPGSAVGRAGLRFDDGGYVHIVYGKPYRRGRVIFGGLVGMDQVWSAGAHRATEMFSTVPLTIGGEELPAGGYSLFLTPGESHWTFHVNNVLGMHLADEYDAAHDVMQLKVEPHKLDTIVDDLTWAFDEAGEAILFSWGGTGVKIPMSRQADKASD